MKWTSLSFFSFKDLISVILIVSFVGNLIYSLKTKDPISVSLFTAQIPIIISVIGIYGTTEGVEMYMSKKNQRTEI